MRDAWVSARYVWAGDLVRATVGYPQVERLLFVVCSINVPDQFDPSWRYQRLTCIERGQLLEIDFKDNISVCVVNSPIGSSFPAYRQRCHRDMLGIDPQKYGHQLWR